VDTNEWKGIEKNIKESKGNKQKIDESIEEYTKILEAIGKSEKNELLSDKEKAMINSTKEVLADTSGDDKQILTSAKKLVTDVLALAKNLKKQAELKK